jgi:hypothetical protein
VEDHVGPRALQFCHQRGKIRRSSGIAFLQHDLETGLLRAGIVALGNVDAVGAVLMNDGNAQILRLLAELLLGVLRDEIHRHHAELVARGLRAEYVFEILVGQHRRRDAGGDPHEVLQLLDPRRHRHALRRGEEAEQHVDLFLLDQPDGLVDRHIRLALGVGVDGLDLVTLDAGLGVLVEHDLGADILQLRTAARERAGQVVNHADLDFFLLSLGGNRHPQHRQCGGQPNEQACSLAPRHGILPWIIFCALRFLFLLAPITLVARSDVKRIACGHIAQARSRPANPGRQGWDANCVSRNAVTKRGIAELRSRVPRTR